MNGVTEDRVADMGDLEILEKKTRAALTLLTGSLESLERDVEILAQKLAAMKVVLDRLQGMFPSEPKDHKDGVVTVPLAAAAVPSGFQ